MLGGVHAHLFDGECEKPVILAFSVLVNHTDLLFRKGSNFYLEAKTLGVSNKTIFTSNDKTCRQK